MKKLIFVFALNFMLITSVFSQKTFKICSKENQELVDGRFVPSDTLGAIPMTGKLIVSKKEIAIYSGKVKLFGVNPVDLKQTYDDVGMGEFYCKKRKIIIRMFGIDRLSEGWIMIIKDNKATTYNYCK
jgi:hypothetical protein